MTLYGLDTSNWQSADGFDVARARAEGFDFLTHKLCEKDWWDPYFAGVYAQARQHFAGRFGAFVFCRVAFSPQAEADQVVAAAAAAGARPGDFPLQIDYEDDQTPGSGADLFARVRAHLARGWSLLPIYVPHWYWADHMGAPDLSGLPVDLWASSYVGGTGYASALYPGDGAASWAGYGGRGVAFWQFSDKGIAAGESPIDVNAFRGTPADLDRLFGGTGMADDIAQAILEQEGGPGASPAQMTGWPAHRYDLTADQQPRFTQTDYLREIDMKTSSRLPVYGDANSPRPVPAATPDDMWGHVLSLRAEVRQVQQMLLAIADAAGVADGATLVATLQGIMAARQ